MAGTMEAHHDVLVQTIPARRGVAVRVAKGQSVRLINTHGSQVVDTWAFNAADLGERMSMEHTRASLNRLFPEVNDVFVTNKRDPIATLVEDTTPGNHDMLLPACDLYRYNKQYGVEGYHDSCADNLRQALGDLGVEGSEYAPSPFNAFMNIPVKDGNHLSWEKAASKPGQYITFRAEMDLIMVFSACPNDVMPINGFQSKEAHFVILEN
jgi:uncharacterized protein